MGSSEDIKIIMEIVYDKEARASRRIYYHTDKDGNRLYPQSYSKVYAFTDTPNVEDSRAKVQDNGYCVLIDQTGKERSGRYERISQECSKFVWGVTTALMNNDGEKCHLINEVPNIGSRGDTLSIYTDLKDFYFATGCFIGNLDEFEEAVTNEYCFTSVNSSGHPKTVITEHGVMYVALIERYKRYKKKMSIPLKLVKSEEEKE